VYSRTLQTLSSARTRIDREFDPAAIARLKDSADRDITFGGAELASKAIAAGLVDECQLFLTPIIVGGGSVYSRATFAPSSSFWASAASEAVSFTCTTAYGSDRLGYRRAWRRRGPGPDGPAVARMARPTRAPARKPNTCAR
jgi:dihydrofolate reductase